MKDDTHFTVRTVNRIAEIDKKAWDSVFPPIIESYNFFKTMDGALSGQFKPYYITIHDKEGVACAAPCILMDYPLDTTVEGPVKKIILNLRRRIPRFLTVRTLICGSPASEGRIGIKDPHREELIKLFAGEMHTIARKEKAGIVAFKDFAEHYSEYLDPLKNMGFYKVPSYPSVRLEIAFKSFEEYLASLSKATRKDLRRKFKKVDGAVQINMEVRNSLGGFLDEAYSLYVNTLKKSEVYFEVLSKEFFRDMPKNMPEETKYFLWFIDGKLAAFDLCLVSGRRLIDEYMGMDYKLAYKYHLYFITFRDIFNWCVKNGIRYYETGALNYDPKKRLDFTFLPQNVYAKTSNPSLNKLFGLLLMLIKPGNFDKSVQGQENNNEK